LAAKHDEQRKRSFRFLYETAFVLFHSYAFSFEGFILNFLQSHGYRPSRLALADFLCYLDDIIVYARTPQELLERLDIVLSRLAQYGLKANPSKCTLFRQVIKFLGHLVSFRGTEPLPEKIHNINDRLAPRCLKELRAFYGLASYYRKFVKNFATIAEPVYSVISYQKSD